MIVIVLTGRRVLGSLLAAHLSGHFGNVSVAPSLSACASKLTSESLVVIDSAGVAPMTGFEAIEEVMRGPKGIRSILLTDASSDVMLRCARRAGASAVASLREDDPAAIVDLVATACNGRFRVSANAVPAANQRFAALLSERQLEAYLLCIRGYTDEQVAQRMGTAVSTAESHRTAAMVNLNLHSFPELVGHALRHGILSSDQLVWDSAIRRSTRKHQAQRVAA